MKISPLGSKESVTKETLAKLKIVTANKDALILAKVHMEQVNIFLKEISSLLPGHCTDPDLRNN